MSTSVSIVVVNWNAGEQLSTCLRSISRTAIEPFAIERVVIVDNASSDGSADAIPAEAFPIQVIRNSENRGFGAACNQGALECASDYILFLNPDAALHHDSLRVPLAFLESPANADVGICGIQLVDEDGQISRSCARFPSPPMEWAEMLGLDHLFPRAFHGRHMREWDHRDSRDVDHVIGAFYLVRRVIFRELEGFDERYFVYLEDLDFSLRARKLGWRSHFIADTQAYHKGGGTSDQVKAMRLSYSLRSRIMYGFKHYRPFAATGLLAGTLFVEPMSRLALAAARGSGARIAETLLGYAKLWQQLPALGREIRRVGS